MEFRVWSIGRVSGRMSAEELVREEYASLPETRYSILDTPFTY
jgi:hypothetical protein